MPIYGSVNTPGPGYYNQEKSKWSPAVCRGPLVRTQRFPPSGFQTPAPNEYKVAGGLETVLCTHNAKLKMNIVNQHKFHWEPPADPNNMLSYEQREAYLLENSIKFLNVEDKVPTNKNFKHNINTNKPKMLRYFLYDHPMPAPN